MWINETRGISLSPFLPCMTCTWLKLQFAALNFELKLQSCGLSVRRSLFQFCRANLHIMFAAAHDRARTPYSYGALAWWWHVQTQPGYPGHPGHSGYPGHFVSEEIVERKDWWCNWSWTPSLAWIRHPVNLMSYGSGGSSPPKAVLRAPKVSIETQTESSEVRLQCIVPCSIVRSFFVKLCKLKCGSFWDICPKCHRRFPTSSWVLMRNVLSAKELAPTSSFQRTAWLPQEPMWWEIDSWLVLQRGSESNDAFLGGLPFSMAERCPRKFKKLPNKGCELEDTCLVG